jgi:hypothetical protein
MKYIMTIALTLGLMSGSAMAHDAQYDNTKEPHESPHKAEPPTGGHESLAAATNPVANLVQFQIQNNYTSSSYNVDGDSNAFILQPVISIKLSSEAVPLLVTRTTLPYINTPDFDGGIGTQEELAYALGAQAYLFGQQRTQSLETKSISNIIGQS